MDTLTNGILLIAIAIEDRGGVSIPDYVYYGSSQCTLLQSKTYNGTKNWLGLYCYLGPIVTARSVTFTTPGKAQMDYLAMHVMVLGNVRQSDPGSSGAIGSSTSPSLGVTTSVNSEIIVEAVATSNATADISTATGQTERSETSTGQRLNMSTKVQSVPASVTESWSMGSSNPWAIVAAHIQPYGT